MKTLAITMARQKLGYWLKRALAGEDIGIVVGGQIVGLRRVEVISSDYALQAGPVRRQAPWYGLTFTRSSCGGYRNSPPASLANRRLLRLNDREASH